MLFTGIFNFTVGILDLPFHQTAKVFRAVQGNYPFFYALEPTNPNYDINSYSDDYDLSESGFSVHSENVLFYQTSSHSKNV